MDLIQWQAIVNCDPDFDGKFFYGVLSTKIFCKPSCKSKTPNQTNVRTFDSVEDALRAGLRPCKRCRPHLSDWPGSESEITKQTIEILKRNFTQPITLQSLANELRIDQFHLHRVFKKITGRTPAVYLQEIRLQESKYLLTSSNLPVTEVALQVGFKSVQHFSTVFKKHTGLSPSTYQG
ncbi:MAG TPA: Ada metal-binding domain-containing protein [Verrucomicrobiae bacterium]|nr:Ada metal-binding domain-containing protein [Verrucomicrobiae bacterium]